MTMLQRSMTTLLDRFTDLSDAQLLTEVRTLSHQARIATAQLIASLAELDGRRLYLSEGCSSLFTYCTQVLHLSEHAAYGRIEAARAARRFPMLLDLLANGSITLTTVCLLGPHLTVDNHRSLLDGAKHKSRREVEHIVAQLSPELPIESSVRKLPVPKAMPMALESVARGSDEVQPLESAPEQPPVPPAPKRVTVVKPNGPEQYGVHMTISRETYEKLQRAQELIRHTLPNADPATVVDRALTLLVAKLEKAKFAATTRPRASRQARTGSRYIPAAVRREVWSRDGGQCAFVGTVGRCTERGFLEFHHVMPFADGGQTVTANLELRCRAHNAYESEQRFGPLFVRESVVSYEIVPTRSGPSQSCD